MKHYRRTNKNVLVDAYAFIYAVLFIVCGHAFGTLDWIGKKLVYLIDNSDFFAGCVWTAAAFSIWEYLTK